MSNPPSDPLDEWIQQQREQPTPEISPDFADSILQKIDSPSSDYKTDFRKILLSSAAILVAGAIGFLRVEMILRLFTTSI